MAKISSTEEWQEAVRKHIEKLDDEEKYAFAHAIIFNTALWCGYNPYETIGILRFVEDELIDSIKNTCDGCGECGKDDDDDK